MTTCPSLFAYATKELSQDAMICWLLEWAAKEYREVDPQLAEVGVKFVNALLAKHKAGPLHEIHKVEVNTQDKRIDVLATINDTHVLLIEDKISGADHSGQLERYYKAVREKHPPENIYPIYLKTGNFPHSERCWVEKERPTSDATYQYKVFDRSDFLSVLPESVPGGNAILTDFRDYLQRIEDRTNDYKEWTKGETIGPEAWQGFFKRLEEELRQNGRWPGWGYVPNPAGGFLGFWWEGGDAHAYLQLQVSHWDVSNQHLCFKVEARDVEKTEQRRRKDDYHQRIMRAGAARVRKPGRMRIAKTMTVAVWGKNADSANWLAFDANGKFDFNRTVGNLKEAEEVLAQACQ